MRVLDELDVPFRERNRLLLAAGHAPAMPERSLDDPDLAPVREALDLILRGHEPYPAIAIDRGWNLVAANAAVWALAEHVDIDPALMVPPINAVRATLHPRGLAPLMVNPGQWRAYIRERLARQVATFADDDLVALVEELDTDADEDPPATFEPLKARGPDGRELSFFAMFAGMSTPFEVTTSEIAVELLFPADRETADMLRAMT
jgi:hypothetical protein